jgi:hypothetical protein
MPDGGQEQYPCRFCNGMWGESHARSLPGNELVMFIQNMQVHTNQQPKIIPCNRRLSAAFHGLLML